jgi:hypothetical protein
MNASVLPVTTSDIRTLSEYLSRHDLIDDRDLWIAGYDDTTHGARHAVAANLFYGTRNLMVLTVKDDQMHLLRRRNDGFHVFPLGHVNDATARWHRNLLFPTLEVDFVQSDRISIQATRNRQRVKEIYLLIRQ